MEKLYLIVSYEYDSDSKEWEIMNTWWRGTIKEITDSYWNKERVLIINIIEIGE